MLESSYDLAGIDIGEAALTNNIVETDVDYRRYRITEEDVSPRGIPGFGKGIVCLDSDEHDEGGYIRKIWLSRTDMVDKRLRKLKGLKNDIFPQALSGTRTTGT